MHNKDTQEFHWETHTSHGTMEDRQLPAPAVTIYIEISCQRVQNEFQHNCVKTQLPGRRKINRTREFEGIAPEGPWKEEKPPDILSNQSK